MMLLMKGQHIIIVSVGLSSVDSFFDRYINQSGIYQAWHQPLTLNKMSSYKFKQQFYHPPVSAVSVVASIIIILWQIIQRNILKYYLYTEAWIAWMDS